MNPVVLGGIEGPQTRTTAFVQEPGLNHSGMLLRSICQSFDLIRELLPCLQAKFISFRIFGEKFHRIDGMFIP